MKRTSLPRTARAALTCIKSLWDSQIQNANADTLQIPWNNFFQPPPSGM